MAKSSGLAMLVGGLFLSACATVTPPRAAPIVEMDREAPVWTRIAADEDVARIAGLDEAWSEALASIRTRAERATLAAEGRLLDPQAALPRPAPSPGSYLCRTVKIGRLGDRGGPAIVAYKPFFCYVEAEDDILFLVKQTGSQRPAGRLYPDENPDRLVFIGALALGSEGEPPAYGDDGERDMVGVVERVAPFRFRLVIPRPRFESVLDVIELIPAPQ